MPLFTKESLETLKHRVDIVDVISSHVELKKGGTSYKGLCPFHDEKSPSFTVQKGQNYYHCFGCGAHGDAISFLMQHTKMGFSEAVENLAQRYQVPMAIIETGEEDKDRVDKRALKHALEQACKLYHTLLLHTPEGHAACRYLFSRGIDLDFIKRFRLGFVHPQKNLIQAVLAKSNINVQTLIDAGLLITTQRGDKRNPFEDRITFPICDPSGSVIGFSARKFKEETYGGKYVNTSETPLFKKARILFAFDLARKSIAKERKAVIVEGQLDALRLHFHGLDITVASQGTAFGEAHVKEIIALGVQEVFIAFDSDKAGREAAFKVGQAFSKSGVAVKVLSLPEGSDPDSFVRNEGIEAFIDQLKISKDYIHFLIDQLSIQFDPATPAGKNALVHQASQQIRQWEEPVLVHESLQKLANILQLPHEMVQASSRPPQIYLQKNAYAGIMEIDPDKVLETDFLRWLIVPGPITQSFTMLALENIQPGMLCHPVCRKVYEEIQQRNKNGETCDLLTLASLDEPEIQHFIQEMLQRKVNAEKGEEIFRVTIQKILDRDWMRKREEVRLKIQSGTCSDDEVLNLLQEFDRLKQSIPKIKDKVFSTP